MGPQHPSTHGVLRLMLELDGETVLRTKPVIGYLHTGMEKTGRGAHLRPGRDQRDPHGLPEPAPQRAGVLAGRRGARSAWTCRARAIWIRMLMVELNRVSLAPHVDGHQRHGPRVHVDDDLRASASARWSSPSSRRPRGCGMNHNYIRPGGVAADLPDGWEDDVDDHLRHGAGAHLRVRRAADGPADLPPAHGGRRATDRRGGAGPRAHRARSCARPGVPWDLRRAMPYLPYDEVEFDVIVGTYGDNFDRYSVRLNEIRESIRIDPPDRREDARRATTGCRTEGHAAAARPHRRVDGGAHPPLQDLHRGLPGPEGEVYVAVESPRGELGLLPGVGRHRPSPTGCTSGARASSTCRPSRCCMRGGLMADAVAVISSVDPVMGEVDR